jgi:hypothetical protein
MATAIELETKAYDALTDELFTLQVVALAVLEADSVSGSA